MPGWPIFLTYAQKRRLAHAIAQTEDTRKRLAAIFKNLPREFPAKIMSYDSATGSCGWSLQTYNAEGRRRDAFDAVSGSPTYAPAYPVGNGIMPPPAFPVEVWMTFRVETADKGPAYEFPWACACDSPYSGSGPLGASKVSVGCAPVELETVWTVTVSVTSGTCANWNGVTFSMVYRGDGSWAGNGTAVDGTVLDVRASCNGTTWVIDYQSAGTDPLTGGVFTPPTYSPLTFAWSGVTSAGCPGAQMSITVTE